MVVQKRQVLAPFGDLCWPSAQTDDSQPTNVVCLCSFAVVGRYFVNFFFLLGKMTKTIVRRSTLACLISMWRGQVDLILLSFPPSLTIFLLRSSGHTHYFCPLVWPTRRSLSLFLFFLKVTNTIQHTTPKVWVLAGEPWEASVDWGALCVSVIVCTTRFEGFFFFLRLVVVAWIS